MSTYKDKYIKYKKKYIGLKHGGSDGKRKPDENLFIFISNTYDTDEIKDSIIEGRKDLFKALNYTETIYTGMFEYKAYKRININSDSNIFINLSDMSKTDLISNLTEYKNIYKNVNNVILCISGHGLFSPGLVRFLCNDIKYIELYEILKLINFKSITILTDVCRSLPENKTIPEVFRDRNFAYHEMLKIVKNKNVIAMTASWKGEDAIGGNLIKALTTAIIEKNDMFYNSLKSFGPMFVFICEIIKKNVKIVTNRFIHKLWYNNTIFNRDHSKYQEFKCDKAEICKRLMSVYFNGKANMLLNRIGKRKNKIFKEIKLHFKLLCRDFDKKDHILENSLERPHASIIRT